MNYNKKVKRCKACIMPEVQGRVELDKKGLCEICREVNARSNVTTVSFDNKSSEEKLEVLKRKVNKMKPLGNQYDCAVAVSGGKDSIMTLYIAKQILGLNPLSIFIDNGFVLPQMYENVKNATDILETDLIIYKTCEISQLFKLFINSKKQIYYCRVCHAILDLLINKICKQNQINLVFGGYTKGQQYIRNNELFTIYDESDMNVIELIKNHPVFSKYCDLIKNQGMYFRKHYRNIMHISPFKYIDWDEGFILDTIVKELKFKLPEHSWPDKSSNCSFNYVAQLLAMKQFGFAQHESELSDLVRIGEMSRERALEIIETPIMTEDLKAPLEKIGLSLEDIFNK